MSKNININIPNKERPNLSNLFHAYLVRKSGDEANWYDYYEFDDEAEAEYWRNLLGYGWDDDCDVVFPHEGCRIVPMNNRHNKNCNNHDEFWSQESREEGFRKKRKHRKRSKSKLDIRKPFTGEEDELDEYDLDDIRLVSSSKEIWFYFDYHDKEDRIEFNSLKEFNDYCESMGYYVDSEVSKEIGFRYESHCCLDPKSERVGTLEVIGEHSYGEMFYEACDESELD